MRRMVVDTSNLFWRVVAANTKFQANDATGDKAGLGLHASLYSLRKLYHKFKPDQIAMTFEGSKNWRKEYTKSAACKSGKIYKANRVKDPAMAPLFEVLKAFEDLARQHTSLICLCDPALEGDDLFAGYVKRFTAQGDEVIGVSGDKDFVQLWKHKNFTLINPESGEPRTVESVCGIDDPIFFMFEKAMRGDKGDNVFPAYPRVLKKRLLKCLTDDYELTKIMNETWTFKDPDTGVETVNRVGDLFDENMLLMELDSQPPDIQQKISDTLDRELSQHGKFNFFAFTKFCGKYGLNQIAENSEKFANLLSVAPQGSSSAKKSLVEF